MFIFNRRYFLINKDRQAKQYDLVRFRKFGFKKSLKQTGESISISEIKKTCRIAHQQIQQQLRLDEEMRLCWQNLTENMRQALVLSYHRRSVQGDNYVANVEILDNWLSIDYFRMSHHHTKKQAAWFKLPKLKQFFRAKIRISGRHHIGLRFGNIHLVGDIVNGRLVYGIHWDSCAPSKSLLHSIKHLVADKIAS